MYVNEVAQSHDPKEINLTETSFLQRAQNDNDDYEPLPSRRRPPELPARVGEPRTGRQVSNEYVAVGFNTGACVSDTAPLVPNSDDWITDIKSTDATHEDTSTTQ